MARLVPGLARVVGVDTGQLYSLARDAEGGVLGGAGPADQGGIEDLAGAVLVTASGLLAHQEREASLLLNLLKGKRGSCAKFVESIHHRWQPSPQSSLPRQSAPHHLVKSHHQHHLSSQPAPTLQGLLWPRLFQLPVLLLLQNRLEYSLRTIGSCQKISTT